MESYDLRRKELFSNQFGITIAVDPLHTDDLDAYSGGAEFEEFLRSETISALGEAPSFSTKNFGVGRSSGAVAALLLVGVSTYTIISQAKDFNESIPVIKEWIRRLNVWRKRFLDRTSASFTVEALKLIALGDLHDRFGDETEPFVGLILTNAGCLRAPDGMLRPFGPVYIFIPDKRRVVTHLYSIARTGEIQHRTELPGTDPVDLIGEIDESLVLEAPARDRDPTLGEKGAPRTLANRVVPGSVADPTIAVDDARTREVVAEILDQQPTYAQDNANAYGVPEPTTTFSQLTELAALLAAEAPEEQLQRFLARHPEFLLGFVPRSSGIELAVLAKPPIGVQYRADFAVLATGQGGSRTYLFELEPSHPKLFTQKLIEADALRRPIGQIRDWQQWIEGNKSSFTSDMLRLAGEAPLYPDRSPTGSFRLFPAERITEMWGGDHGYGSFDEPGAIYNIIIGRWQNLTAAERKRLLFLNGHASTGARIVTYDQVARAAYHRTHRGFDES